LIFRNNFYNDLFSEIKTFEIIIYTECYNGDWGLGIGDWGLGPIPNPQSPIPNPQSPIPNNKIIY
jgi:hypothetical protein